MGNGLEKHRKEMSAENFEKFISLLMNTTDLLLMRRKYDKAVEGAEVVQIENTEIYNGSAGNILGRIHSSGPAVDINKLTVPFLVGSMNNDDRSLPANILEAIAKKWRDKDLNGVRKKLLKYKSKLGESEDDKTIQFSDTISLDKKFDVAPKMPPESEREKMAHHWTAFGFFPKSEEKMKMWIDQNMERMSYKRIGTEEAVVFSDWGEIIGRIEPVKSRTARTDIEINSLEEIVENWEFMLTMLIKTSEKLLMRKKVDTAVASGVTVSRQPRVDIYKDSSAGNVMARIRPFGAKNVKIKPGEAVTLKFGATEAVGGALSPALLESLPNWGVGEIRNTRNVLIDLRAQSRRLHDMNCSIKEKRKEDVFPPKPRPGKKYGECADWTAFGFCPTSKKKTKQFIDKLTAQFESTRIGDNAVVFTDSSASKVAGRIEPLRSLERTKPQRTGKPLKRVTERLKVKRRSKT